MPTNEKIEAVKELSDKLASADAIFLADFTGIDVESVTNLRNQLREASAEYQVVKNRLAILAADAAGMSNLNEHLTGPTALTLVKEDPAGIAKILQTFIDDGGKLAIKSGLLDGQIMSAEEVEALSKLPSKEELLAKAVGTIQGPLNGLVGGLSGLMRNLVGVVAAIEEKQREAE